MTDPVTVMVNLTTRLCIHIGLFIGSGVNAIFMGALKAANRRSRPSRAAVKRQRIQEDETTRIAGVRQVVLDFGVST